MESIVLKVLWVEDEKENIDEYTDEYFDELFSEPIVPISFTEACEYTQDNLGYDFVIIDINLEKFTDFDSDFVKKIKEKISFDETNAGIVIFTRLLESGFPKERILFLTANAKGQGSNTYDRFEQYFNSALMPVPDSILKDGNGPENLSKTLKSMINPYLTLRRGIIEGCQYAKNLPDDRLYFNKYTNEPVQPKDIVNYLEILENFLPLREPKNKTDLYKLFTRTLSHEWEAAKIFRFDKEKPDAVLARIMRNTRHWITHNSSLFNEADEQLIAFLFVVNMRVMYSSKDYAIQTYENILLKLFDNNSLTENKFKEQIIPVSKAYLDLRNIIRDENQNSELNIEEAFYFNEMANNIQLSSSLRRDDKKLFTKILYQMFWLTTCNPFVDKKNNTSLEIKFWNFNYFDKPYLLKLARSIYNHSFS